MTNNGKIYESEFEEAFIVFLQETGWRYTYGDNLHRKLSDPLIEDDLREFLDAKYDDNQISNTEKESIIANLRNISGQNDYYTLQKAFTLYRDGYNFIYGENHDKVMNLEYIDFEHPNHNIFRCVNQFTMEQGQENRRPDILLFINGIPVCIIELKNPTNQNATVREAHTQICKRYMRDIPNLLKYTALAVISDGAKNELGTPFTPFEFFYEWKKVDNEDKAGVGLDTLRTLIGGALSPERILEIIRDYVYFPDPTNENDTTEIVCRYPQFFATRKLRDNILKHLRSVKDGDGKGGTYFGATGCGKTYTMLFLARQLALRCREKLGSPTILIIVDREDLETQSGKLFCSSKRFLMDNSVKVFESRNELSNEMSLRKTGGIYITTIQKFTDSTGLLTDRSNVICMSDEAHRSQNNIGSKLVINDNVDNGNVGARFTFGFAKYLRDALPNATYVGFTGTPKDETIYVFGDIVDQYTMKQSERDGITVPIKYDPRLARVFMDSEQAKKVEDYYKICAEEGANDEDIAASKKAMSGLEAIIGDEDVLKRVATDIIKDYKVRTESTDRVQKAMITCVNREIAYKLYKTMRDMQPDWFEKKKALDENLLTPDERNKLPEVAYVNMVMTRDKDDEKELYNLLGDKEHRKDLDKWFKDEKSNFHISINVDMWITGFDVPCLTMLYNDKPLQKHTLIQTISRVNRKYKDKECGFIIDYIGIREEMKKAMKVYGGDKEDEKEDLDVSYEILQNELQILKEKLSALDFTPFFGSNAIARLLFIQRAAEYILSINSEKNKDDNKEYENVDNSSDKNSKKKEKERSFKRCFNGHVKRLRYAFNICNPAGKVSDDDVKWCQCFMGICSYVNKLSATKLDTAAMNKHVEEMVKEAIMASGVERVLDMDVEENIFGEEFSKELDDMKMPFTKFQILCKLVQKAIKEYGKTNKLKAKEFQVMLEETIDEYNKRDNLTFANNVAESIVTGVSDEVINRVNSLSEDLIRILRELGKDKAKFKELGITFEEKAFYDILVEVRNEHKFEYANERCIELAKKIKLLIDDTSVYADWLNNNNLKSDLAVKLVYLIYHEGYPPQWKDEVFARVLEQVENYKNNQ